MIAASEIDRYQRDGVVCLRQPFDTTWIECLKAATERSLQAGGMEMSKDGDRGRFHSNLFMWHTDPDFRAFAFDSPAAGIARTLTRSTAVRFYFDHLFV